VKRFEDYSLHLPVKTIAGEGSIKQLPDLLASLGSTHPLFIISRKASGTGIVELLGVAQDPVILSAKEISSNTASKLVEIYSTGHHDAIVAVGGGSVMDIAKTAKLMLSDSSRNPMELEGLGGTTSTKHVPLIVIPTTLGSGSGGTKLAYVRNSITGPPLRIDDTGLFAEIALLDPKMSKSVSGTQTAYGVAAILGRAIESMTSILSVPTTEAFAMQALKLVVANSFRVVHTPHDLEARLHIAIASQLAGSAISHTGGSIAHTLSIVLSQTTDISYGLGMRILLPHALRYNLAGTEPMLARLNSLMVFSNNLFADDPVELEEDALLFIHWVSEFFTGLTSSVSPAIPSRFYDVMDQKGQERVLLPQQMEAVATIAYDSLDLLTSRQQPTIQDLIRVLEAAYWGYPLDHNDGQFSHTHDQKR